MIRAALLAAAAAGFSSTLCWASTPRSAEAETLRISKLLKPIPNDEWQKIAGAKVTEKYAIAKGDTLWDVSRKLFGEDRYWPKLWALNRHGITNPHQIKPGMQLAFLAGTGSALPGLTVSDGATPVAVADASLGSARSGDWKALPKQRWEKFETRLPPEVSLVAFDEKSRVRRRPTAGIDPPALAASDRIELLGDLVASRSYAEFLGLGDLVFMRARENLQVGDTYSITEDPYTLRSVSSDRKGYSYRILGKVKILGVRDGVFYGMLIEGKDVSFRGAYLIREQPIVRNLKIIPAKEPLEATVMLDPNFSVNTVAQHQFVFIDKGSDDGVEPGMVFRSYQHVDPVEGTRFTNSDFVIDQDMMVVQASARISIALVVSSVNQVEQDTAVVLLTDVSDIFKHKGVRVKTLDGPKAKDELDELEALDSGEGMGKDEARELKQLEEYKKSTGGASDGSEGGSPGATGTGEPSGLEPPGGADGEAPPEGEKSKSGEDLPSGELAPPEGAGGGLPDAEPPAEEKSAGPGASQGAGSEAPASGAGDGGGEKPAEGDAGSLEPPSEGGGESLEPPAEAPPAQK